MLCAIEIHNNIADDTIYANTLENEFASIIRFSVVATLIKFVLVNCVCTIAIYSPISIGDYGHFKVGL